MTLPYWADNNPAEAARWNTVRLGTVQLPGLCVVTAEKGRDLDTKKAKGQDGYKSTDNGATPGKVTIELTLANRAEWMAWQKARPLIDPNRPGATRSPLEINHPAAADRGIQNIYVTNIKTSPPTARGGMKISLDCEEWFPSVKTSKGAGKNAKSVPATWPQRGENSFVALPEGESKAGQDFVDSFKDNF
ncbi:MAG TPA: hypothetical protein VK550_19380 [Polyangiaceae bacterium]|nr:hypothetical protein [Polyangiaceae bacterium]